MLQARHLLYGIGGMVLLFGCGGGSNDIVIGGSTGDCALTNETLDGTQWVMWEAMPTGDSRENYMARMKFFQEDGKQKLRYTVKSPGDVYTYGCKERYKTKDNPADGIKEWVCKEESHIQDMCQALEAHEEGSCTIEKLKEFGAVGSAEEFEKDMGAAMKTVAKYRGKPDWDRFKLNNNNLGNKLQGIVYAKVNTKKCQLMVTDMYMTIYNGKRLEDSNPVGSNPFVQSDEEFMYEHCLDPINLLDWPSAELPKDLRTIPRQRVNAFNQPVHYHYMGQKEVKAVEGCNYSMDLYAQWRAKEMGISVPVGEKGVVQWNTTHTWTDMDALKLIAETKPGGILTMVRYKQCAEGEKEQIDVLCNAAWINPGPG